MIGRIAAHPKQISWPPGRRGESEDIMRKMKLSDYTYIKPFGYEVGNRRGKAVLLIDKYIKGIDVLHISGTAPYAENIIMFLLSDKDVRSMIKDFQSVHRERCEKFSLRCSQRSSGCEDIYLNYYTDFGLQTDGCKVLHISSYGKLNEGWDCTYIGDFVELVAYLKGNNWLCHDLKKRRKLRTDSKCWYTKPYFDKNAKNETSVII